MNMDDNEIFKSFSISFFNRLKNTVNGSVRCTINESEDKMYIEINKLGVQYKTSVNDISNVIAGGDTSVELEFDKVIKKYRSFIKHKFFY